MNTILNFFKAVGNIESITFGKAFQTKLFPEGKSKQILK